MMKEIVEALIDAGFTQDEANRAVELIMAEDER